MLRQIKTINAMTLAFVLAAIAVSTTLTDTTLNRNAFYLSAFIAVITLLIRRPRNIPREAAMVALGVFLVGLSQLIWHWRFPAVSMMEADEDYLTTSLRLIVGAALILALGTLRDSWGRKTLLAVKVLIVVGFFYTSYMGLYYYLKTPDVRLQIKTVSTMTAYIYVLQSLLTIYVIASLNLRRKSLAIAAVILITLGLILLTETRSSLLLYPIILLMMFGRRHHISLRTMAIACVITLLAAAITSHFFSKATERLVGTATELGNYQKGDGNSSLGSRISMWKAGVDAILHHPNGQGTATRLASTTDYINRHEGGNPEALRNLVFHLHNDVIDAGSLQGLIGLTAVVLFYLLTFYASRLGATARPVLLLVLLPTVVIGMVDTLFIDHRYVTNLTLLLAIYLCLSPSAAANAGPNEK
ncbi:O-antigen ligase family protein [Serratia nevei]|uniref:O-antigen ligase family protein n=1 Tax=Serratia nevei TaxID=2703794 RepID=UPI00209E400B|nr:O-antigen ligase family protein [Serratia nevei]MCP1107655.1 O-antigen ligase family protein [Serratia nevei]